MIGWELVYEDYVPADEGIRESLCTLGNGYFATRGAAHEASADDVHYPGTYIAGCYNRLPAEIAGHALEHEDLVNAPNWLPLAIRPAGGAWIEPSKVEISGYRQVLDLLRGVLTREMRIRDASGRTTRITSRRLVHMQDPHVAALEVTVTAEDWSGPIEIRSAIDGSVRNRGVERYRSLPSQHLAPVEARSLDEETIFLEMRTTQSGIRIAEAARTRVSDERGRRAIARRLEARDGFVAHEVETVIERGRPLVIEKVVALYTSRDHAISTPAIAAAEKLAATPGMDVLLASHEVGWKQLWRSFDIEVEVAVDCERPPLDMSTNLRLHVFHLLQTASQHTIDLDAGVGARGLHGEAYKGHVLWDELFVFPLLNYRAPHITYGFLRYRFQRLDTARRAARAAGYRGAMFPWQSGSDGREETPRYYVNPRTGGWIVDSTHLQRHVGAAIAYNVWQHYQVTGDRGFLVAFGAELMLEIARFFASIASHDEGSDRYVIRGVVGPDEFHTAYPDASAPGLVDNAYTNAMAAWVLWRALEVLDLLPRDHARDLRERLALDDDELLCWDTISRRLRLPFLDGGILAQFEGYDRLAELDWERYRERYGNIQRLDLILDSEHDSTHRYKASKQADVLMLFYLFSTEEITSLFERLGYPFDGTMIPRTIDYYLRRTSDGSTLSRIAHAWVLARSDRAHSWRVACQALASDVTDIQGGTTREGIHLGAMAGSVDLLERCYTALELRGDVLWLNPRLPDPVQRLAMLVRYRGHTLHLAITHDTLEVNTEHCDIPVMTIGIRDTVHELAAGTRRTFSLVRR